MNRRQFLLAAGASPWAGAAAEMREPHFPDRLHQFVFRNWELANAETMARVVRTSAANILDIGKVMGLPPKPQLTTDQLRRIYITVIRQNWRLLPNPQIVELLGWTGEKFEFTLREDDFLDVKLGPKPDCVPLVYAAPPPAARRRAAEIARTLREVLGAELDRAGEPPFQFVQRLSAKGPGASPDRRKPVFDLRYLYSYFALYGDPLLEPEIDPFPDGYLEKLSAAGINGVWMQGVLRNLAPSKIFPEFGSGAEVRLANLNKLVERAGKSGIRVYLYLNEPRAMPPDFFARHPELKGARSRNVYAMCTSVPAVRQWISDSLAHVFRQAPGLGGVFSITMSENMTNCFAHLHPETCPRCSQRKSWEVVGEVLAAIHSGVRSASRSAEVIAWDWGWPEEMAERLIPRLPRDSRFQSVSEWSIPIERGGVKTAVGEYSISVVGPGPRATRHWALAKAAGVPRVAKTQFNNTWEISAVPYVPAARLIAQHCANLRRAGVSGVMASWTLGGYPSPNLEIANEFYFSPKPDVDAVLLLIATRRYGEAAALLAVEAWKTFSDAFEQFPYGVAVYTIPTQHGPANLLRDKPSGVKSSMILFPQDDYKRWAGEYPPAVVREQFSRMADLWERGLITLRKALAQTANAAEDLAIAETCYLHFRSVANQVEFYMLRDSGDAASRARMRELMKQEIDLARRLYPLARRHSVIAYEASNHYYYRPLDLAEKILNCRRLLESTA